MLKIRIIMNKKAKKITSIVVSCLTGLIVLMVIYMLACNVIAMQRERPVQIFGYSYSYVPTESMEPTIKKGDSVIFKDISYISCEVGDIIPDIIFVYVNVTSRL